MAVAAGKRLGPYEIISPLGAGRTGSDYDVTADGQRFLVVLGSADEITPFTVIANWTADLKR